MKLVLKVRHANQFFSADTETGLTRSPNKATNVNIGRVLKNTPEWLTYFEFYLVEKRGATPVPLINLKAMRDKGLPQVPFDYDPHSDEMMFVLSRRTGDIVYENYTSQEFRQAIIKDVQIDTTGEYQSGVMVYLADLPEPIDAGFIFAKPE